MVKFYAMQIKLDKITLEDVPVKWKSRVEKDLRGEYERIYQEK